MALGAPDLRLIEERLGVKLPAAYASFLRSPDLQPWARLGRMLLSADEIIAATRDARRDAATGVILAELPADVICIGGDRAAEWLLLSCNRARVHLVTREAPELDRGLTWERFRLRERATPLWVHLARWAQPELDLDVPETLPEQRARRVDEPPRSRSFAEQIARA